MLAAQLKTCKQQNLQDCSLDLIVLREKTERLDR